MPKQMKANYSFVRRSLFLLLVVSFLITTAFPPRLCARTPRQTNASEPKLAAVTEALRASFGTSLEAVTGFNPFYLTGDFNGDGSQDILIVVRVKGRRSELPPDVKVLNPFYRTREPAFPTDPAAKPTLAFAIIHGTNAGWNIPQPAGKFLLLGESPILILENDRATSGNSEDAKGLMEIVSKRGKRRAASRPPPAAKGDSILLGTEATESILYWNGKTYRWQESEGGE
jgi:hypothetical protein